MNGQRRTPIMHSHNDEEEESFEDKIEESKNIEIQLDGAVAGKDFREVILKQMQLTHRLFQRQHQDVLDLQEGARQFTASSKRVEKLSPH